MKKIILIFVMLFCFIVISSCDYNTTGGDDDNKFECYLEFISVAVWGCLNL